MPKSLDVAKHIFGCKPLMSFYTDLVQVLAALIMPKERVGGYYELTY